MKADAVCEKYSNQSLNLLVKVMGDENGEFVLLEGDKEALMFLSELIAAIATEQSDSNIQLAPNGPGSRHFAPNATAGLYLQLRKPRAAGTT